LVGISFCFEKTKAFYVPFPDDFDSRKNMLQEFKAIFENENIEKTGQNIKYDMIILAWYDIRIRGKIFDTMIAHYLIEPDQRHGMDYLAETYLDYKTISYDELTEKRRGHQLNIRDIQHNKINVLVDYACEDADITLQLADIFRPLLEESKTLDLYENIEAPLIPVLTSMEMVGINLDSDALNKYSGELQIDVLNIRSRIYEHAGTEFNVSSPKQLGEILFERLKITDKPKLTKTKQYSTGEDILQKMLKKHPIVQEILDYRSLTKLKSTYVDALPLLVNPKDSRIHTSYMQSVAATGRLSSQNPNLQNIPIRTAKGREIRKAFIPRNEEFTLLAADYSQIELRIIAELSEDVEMLKAFKNGIDIHTATASKVYHTPIDEVDSDMRRNAKAVNFGIVYGISAFGLSEQLGIQRKEAAEIINQYFIQYTGVKKFMDNLISFARENGFVETIMGRRRYLRDINSNNAVVRGFAERNAINAPIQGSSADMIKIAMINIFREFEKYNLKSKMILQVHDELVFDTHKSELDIVKQIVEEKMRTAIKMEVPIVVDMNTGNNWLEAH
jgi:DNA polymerase-1